MATKRLNQDARIWSMSNNQEIALKQMWAQLLKLFGYQLQMTLREILSKHSFCPSNSLTIDSSSLALSRASSNRDLERVYSSQSSFTVRLLKDKIKSTFISLESGGLVEGTFDTLSVSSSEPISSLSNYLPEEIHRSLWASCRNDSIDNFMLRFLRMSNFDPNLSLKWFVKVLDKRQNKFDIDLLLSKGDAIYSFIKDKVKLVEAFKRNEMFMHGESKSKCPLIFIRSKEHIRGLCPEDDFQILILLMFEWGRLKLLEFKFGIDRVQLCFDLTGFTLKNADYGAISFVVRALQKYYPDYVERIYVHNEPRVFSIIWNIIVRWMLPELRVKIHFTHTLQDLQAFIEDQYIPQSLGGKGLNFTKYIEPTEHKYGRKDPDEMLFSLLKQRDELTVKFIEATIRWVEASTIQESRRQLREKIHLSKAMAENYDCLDPYLRQRGLFDRNGELSSLSI